jgi:hypothetical protein
MRTGFAILSVCGGADALADLESDPVLIGAGVAALSTASCLALGLSAFDRGLSVARWLRTVILDSCIKSPIHPWRPQVSESQFITSPRLEQHPMSQSQSDLEAAACPLVPPCAVDCSAPIKQRYFFCLQFAFSLASDGDSKEQRTIRNRGPRAGATLATRRSGL